MLGPAQRYAKPAKRGAITVLVTAALADGYAATARAVIVLLPHDVEPYRVLTWSPLPVAMAR
jgi:general secretion pathway protein K